MLCHSLIRNEACNCYVPPPVLPTSGWVWNWRACYFLPVAHSQRSFRKDQRAAYRRNPTLPHLAEEPDFDSPFNAAQTLVWGLPLKFSLGSARVRSHARLCSVSCHVIVVNNAESAAGQIDQGSRRSELEPQRAELRVSKFAVSQQLTPTLFLLLVKQRETGSRRNLCMCTERELERRQNYSPPIM